MPKVKMTIWVDNDRTNACNSDEEIYYACLTSKEAFTIRSVSRKAQIVVWVYAAWRCPRYLIPDVADDPGGGTSGTVTITWV